MSKFKLTDEKIILINKIILYRIESLENFADVKKGDKGGFIEKESNLSQYGNAWVYNNAKVHGNAKVTENAQIRDNAMVCNNAVVCGNAKVFDRAIVCDTSTICGNAHIFGKAFISDKVHIRDNAHVFGNAWLGDCVEVHNSAKVCGIVKVSGNAIIVGDAILFSNNDYIVFKNWWSSGRYFTWTRSNNMWKVGCFYGSGKQLVEKAYQDSEISGKEYERIVNYVNNKEYETKRKRSFIKRLMQTFTLWGKMRYRR